MKHEFVILGALTRREGNAFPPGLVWENPETGIRLLRDQKEDKKQNLYIAWVLL